MKRPTENMEVTPMQVGKKKVAIGIALGTLVIALLAVTAIGSASKCRANCSGSEITDQWLATKAGFKDLVKNDYTALAFSHVKSNTSVASTTPKAVSQRTNGAASKALKNSLDRDRENFKKALVAILIVMARESIQQPISR